MEIPRRSAHGAQNVEITDPRRGTDKSTVWGVLNKHTGGLATTDGAKINDLGNADNFTKSGETVGNSRSLLPRSGDHNGCDPKGLNNPWTLCVINTIQMPLERTPILASDTVGFSDS
jgi:hypothetical protein